MPCEVAKGLLPGRAPPGLGAAGRSPPGFGAEGRSSEAGAAGSEAGASLLAGVSAGADSACAAGFAPGLGAPPGFGPVGFEEGFSSEAGAAAGAGFSAGALSAAAGSEAFAAAGFAPGLGVLGGAAGGGGRVGLRRGELPAEATGDGCLDGRRGGANELAHVLQLLQNDLARLSELLGELVDADLSHNSPVPVRPTRGRGPSVPEGAHR